VLYVVDTAKGCTALPLWVDEAWGAGRNRDRADTGHASGGVGVGVALAGSNVRAWIASMMLYFTRPLLLACSLAYSRE